MANRMTWWWRANASQATKNSIILGSSCGSSTLHNLSLESQIFGLVRATQNGLIYQKPSVSHTWNFLSKVYWIKFEIIFLIAVTV